MIFLMELLFFSKFSILLAIYVKISFLPSSLVDVFNHLKL